MTSKEALDSLRFDVSMAQYINYLEANKECDIIEKELNALEIIKEKRVDCKSLIECGDADEYNNLWFDIPLDQEEFDLLKEVLCNDKC